MNDCRETIAEYGLVPVVKIHRAEDAVPLVRALRQGGLPVAEITFRTDAAEQAIADIAAREPDILLGAGTVLTVDQAQRAVEAGAAFIVSPGLNLRVCRWCLDRGIPVIPGVNSPSGIEQALEMGLALLKFFPAEASGGLPYLKAMAAPYRDVRFMPTGGVNQSNLASYLAYERVAACGGTWLGPVELMAQERFHEISLITRRAVATALGLTLVRIELKGGQAPSEALCAMFDELLDLAGTGPAIRQLEAPEAQGDETPTAKLVFTSLNPARARSFLRRMGLADALDAQATGPGPVFVLEP